MSRKVKNPQIQVKFKSQNWKNIEYKSCSTTWADPKTVFEPYPDCQKQSISAPKAHNDPDLGQKQKLKLKEGKKIKKWSLRRKP